MSDLRWYVKKAARGGMAFGVWGSGALRAAQVISSGPRIRVLTYHRFGHERREAFCVSPSDFELQMAWLSSHGLAVSLEDVIEFAHGRRPLRDKSVLVTIDDGCVSTLDIALPILQKFRVPAVAFVTSSLIGMGELGLPERYMDWDELRACAKGGLTIGSHAYSHRSLGQMPLEDARNEARRSREKLEEELGQRVTSFAYPFGTHGDFNAATDRELMEAGYEVAFNSQHGAVRFGCHRDGAKISLPRIKVEGGEPLLMFRLLVKGAMDPWRAIDRNLWRFQRARKEIAVEEPAAQRAAAE
jgi:peptidoglycan/xylan/chitin deacetylase (PgdA/CDA1 family)